MTLHTDGLTKRFDGTTAVADVSLTVETGEFFSLVGPSGCGKTTTLRMIAGLAVPTEGRVELDGTAVTGRPARDRDTNLVFQDLVLFPHMTVAENVAYGLARSGVPRPERNGRVAEMLETVGLEGFGPRDPTDLSGGQRQRVALARGLVNEPAVLLLDEPLSSLDRTLRAEMRGELRRIQRDVGTTFLYVTHDQESAMSMSDRIGVMRDGRVVETGSPQELYARPQTAFAADFFGDANLLSAEVLDVTTPVDGDDSRRVSLDAGHGQFVATTGDADPVPGQRVTAVVRPEDLRPGGDTFVGEVRDVEYRGFYREYTVVVDGEQTLDVRDGSGRRLQVGERIGLGVENAVLVPEAAAETAIDLGPVPVAAGGDTGRDDRGETG